MTTELVAMAEKFLAECADLRARGYVLVTEEEEAELRKELEMHK
jgi:hypothetical protein